MATTTQADTGVSGFFTSGTWVGWNRVSKYSGYILAQH